MRLRVALVQLALRPPTDGARAERELALVIQEAADRGAELVVLPQDAGAAVAADAAAPTLDETVAIIALAARTAGVHVAAGVGGRGAPGTAATAPVAVLVDAAGGLLAAVASAGDGLAGGPARELPEAVVDTSVGRLGMLLGTALSDPVPARRLAEAGVCALIVPSALWATERLAAAERQAAMDRARARARENGMAVLTADWSGRVAGRRFLGTTAAYGPGGSRRATVAPGRGGLALTELELPPPLLRRSRGARIPPLPPPLPKGPRRTLLLAAAQGPDHGGWAPVAVALAPDLLVAPMLPRGLVPQPLVARLSIGRVRTSASGQPAREILRGERFVPSQRLVDLGGTRAGVLFGDEVTAPEPSRLLAAEGAQVLILFAESLDLEDARFWARVRARENGAAAVVSARSQATVVAPDGRVAAEGAVRRSSVVAGRVTVGGTRGRRPREAPV